MANITPYKRGVYPVIEGNDRIYFDSEFRKIEECLRSVLAALTSASVADTIASGVAAFDESSHLSRIFTVDTESAGATDDLDTINGGKHGQLVIVRAANSSRTIVCKDGTGNLKLAGDHSLDNTEDSITLLNVSGTTWIELARSNNGA
jgi:hypothetical protein